MQQKEFTINSKALNLGNFFFPRKENLIFLLLSSVFIGIISYLYLGCFISKGYYSIIISLIISSCFSLRLLIYFNQQFRFKLSSEIQSLTFSLHSELSRGLVLDQACLEVFQKKTYPILDIEIRNFLKQHISDINEKLPEFYFSLSEKFKIKYLALPAQILGLEMKFSSNPSSAFEAAYNYFAHCDKNQNLLKSSLGIVFITMDAMVLIYLTIIFFILPSINLADSSWWESSSRPLEMFFSSSLFWLGYLTAILLIKNREDSLA